MPSSRPFPYYLSGVTVGKLPVEVRRSDRRTLTLKVTAAGVVIYAPQRLGLAQLREVLESKRVWAEQHLVRLQAELAPQAITDGDTLNYLGRPLSVRLVPAAQLQRLGDVLLTPAAQPVLALQAWYREQAQHLYPTLVSRYAAQLPARARPLSAVKVSGAQGRWGSCTASGVIRLHWRLLLAPPEVMHYVAAHETAHLSEMNHSPRYWAQVAALLPSYPPSRRWLREHGGALMRQLSVSVN